MADPEKDAPDDQPKVNPDLEAVKSIAEKFTAELAAERAARMKDAPAVTPSAPTHDPAAEWEKLAPELDELAAAGKTSEAIAKTLQWAAKQGQQGNVDPANTPAFKHMVESTRRAVKGDAPEVFQRWGSEVNEIVNRLPAEQRLLHESWEQAVRQVRASHIDEIVREQAAAEKVKWEEEYKTKFAPLAGGSRGGGTAAAAGLNEEEALVAHTFQMTPDEYKKHKKVIEQNMRGDRVIECPFLDEDLPKRAVGRSVIPPGKF